MENSIYSVISPEGCASIMWRDSSKKDIAAAALRITAKDNFEMGFCDEVIPEPPGGAHTTTMPLPLLWLRRWTGISASWRRCRRRTCWTPATRSSARWRSTYETKCNGE